MKKTYLVIADTVAEDIRSGKLQTGERLSSQRLFAYEYGIANSTAGRVYAELVRRQLISGEVGRGSYVRAYPPKMDEQTLLEVRKDAKFDMETNFPILPAQANMMVSALQSLIRPDVLDKVIRPISVTNDEELIAQRVTVSRFLGCTDWQPDPACILFPDSGRQAIGATMAALVPVGGRLGVERLTYPILKGLANNLGRTLIPIAIDEEGVIPEALVATHKEKALDAVYLQPTLHNPTGNTMSIARRIALAKIAVDEGFPIIEDQVYRFLIKENLPPIAKFAPENVILIDSISKRIAPGLSLGFIATPRPFLSAISITMKQFGWVSGAFAIEAMFRWISDGTVEKIAILKREDVARRQITARKILLEYVDNCSKDACHLWLNLPHNWDSDSFVLAAKQKGIIVAAGSAFGVGYVPDAVRISLVSMSYPRLEYSLRQLAGLLKVKDSEI